MNTSLLYISTVNTKMPYRQTLLAPNFWILSKQLTRWTKGPYVVHVSARPALRLTRGKSESGSSVHELARKAEICLCAPPRIRRKRSLSTDVAAQHHPKRFSSVFARIREAPLWMYMSSTAFSQKTSLGQGWREISLACEKFCRWLISRVDELGYCGSQRVILVLSAIILSIQYHLT